MATTVKEDLTRPTVNVKVPEVRLKLEDLAYLRSIGQEDAQRCHPGSGVINRLKFLDLIARAKVGPSASERKEIAGEIAKERLALKDAIAREDWGRVSNCAFGLQGLSRKLEPREDDVLTERGKQLLRQGEVDVKVRKVGCV